MAFYLKNILFSLAVLYIISISKTKCQSESMSLEDIRVKVAEAIKSDYLELLRQLMDQEESPSQRVSRSKYLFQSSYHPNITPPRFGKRRLSKNHAEYKRKSNRLMQKKLRRMNKKHMKNHLINYLISRRSPVIDIKSPSIRRLARLRNRLSKTVKVTNESVRGTSHLLSPYTLLQMESVGFGAILIKGVDSDRYICMNQSNGKVYVTQEKSLECVFLERLELNHRFTYQSFLHRKNSSNWYLSINKENRPTNGRKSAYFKKGSQFIKF